MSELDVGNTSDEFINDKEKETSFDLIGKQRLLKGDFNGFQTVHMSAILNALSASADDNTTIVMGHPNPDADSITSAIFEATRKSLLYPTKKYLAWADSMPNKVRFRTDLQL